MPACRPLLRADVNQAVEKGSRRHDERVAFERVAVFHRDAGDRPSRVRMRPAFPSSHVIFGSRRQRRGHPRGVALLVGLRAWRPDRRTAAAVQQLELDAGRVDRASHQAAKRVDFANEMSLRRSAHGRIARHVRDRVLRQRAQTDAAPEPRGGVRRFDARVAGADHDDVEIASVYLPMQKRSKMWRSTSSLVRRPTISSRRMRARLEIDQQEFFGNVPGFRRAACRVERRAALFEQRDVARVGDPALRRAAAPRRPAPSRSSAAARRSHRPTARSRRRPRGPSNVRAASDGRSLLFNTTIRFVLDVSSSSRAILIRQRLAAIEHQQHQVRDVARVRAARHAFRFDDVARVAPAGGVDERHGDALDVDRLGHQVARGPWNRP